MYNVPWLNDLLCSRFGVITNPCELFANAIPNAFFIILLVTQFAYCRYPCSSCYILHLVIGEPKKIVPLCFTLKILHACQFIDLDKSICTLSQGFSVCKNHYFNVCPSSAFPSACLLPSAILALLFVMCPNVTSIFTT